MSKIKLLLIAITLIISYVATAQTNGTITGTIKDGGNQQVIDAATISLLRVKDSSLVKISLSDKGGNFSFEHLKTGNYLVKVTSIDHLKVFSNTISVNDDQVINVGTLQLISSTKSLKEVVVETKKPLIERKIDKTILNVDALISNAGSTALDVLEKAPGVSVDKDGNISLKGKQGVHIMLDGKPSYLSGEQLTNLLKNMPASAIEQIEIMTNPSAKYDASGNSGIINIKTKKSKLQGFNGSVSSSYIQGVYPKFNEALNLNYRKGKINVFLNMNYSTWIGYHDLHINRNFRNSVTKQLETIFDQQSYMTNSSHYQSLKSGIDFYKNKKTTLGVVFSGFINPLENPGDNFTYLKNAQGGIDSMLYATSMSNQRSTNWSANFNYRHVFDSTGTELTADLDYITYDQSGSQLFENNFLDANMNVTRPSTQLRGSLPSKVHIYSAKTDYSKTIWKSIKLEAGIKSSYVSTDNNALYENNSTGGWLTDYGKTNHFIYDENINAGYINLNKQVKKWGFQAGLRVENTNARGHQLGNITRPDSSFTRNYTNAFPTVFISYDANKKNTFSINYGRRIDRPAYQDLNPFYYFLDEYTYEVGNTLLKPQFTNAIELSHTYKGFLTTTLNYSKTNDVITDVLNQINAERKTFVSKDNIATRRDVGIALSAYFPISKIWTTNIYGNLANNKYNGALNGGVLNVNSTMFMGNMTNQFKFKKGWSAELSGFYRSKGIEGQIVANEMWSVSTGVQKQVLKNRGTIKLSVSDVFNSQRFVGYVQYQDIDVRINEKNDTRRASLTFTYRFGKAVQQQQRRKTGGASDEQQRVKTGN